MIVPDAEFVLDKVENPHPRMRSSALEYRRRAQTVRKAIHVGAKPTAAMVALLMQWDTYLEAMCDATGCTPAEIEEWLDRDLDE